MAKSARQEVGREVGRDAARTAAGLRIILDTLDATKAERQFLLGAAVAFESVADVADGHAREGSQK